MFQAIPLTFISQLFDNRTNDVTRRQKSIWFTRFLSDYFFKVAANTRNTLNK